MSEKEKKSIFEDPVVKDDENPFASDKISKNNELKIFAENLEKLVDAEVTRQNHSLIISIYADWGIGKTTFIDMWGQKLINDGVVALKFDAWKCDHSEEPILPFMLEIDRQFNIHSIAEKEQFTEAAIGVVTSILSSINFHVPLLLPVSINVDKILGSVSECFKKETSKIDVFKKVLTEVANENNKIYIFIDELDRCNPIFAVKLLEIAKHLFNVIGICFILSINRESLKSTIKKIYGLDVNMAGEYLERFFDFQLKLPEPDMAKYAEINLGAILDSLQTSNDPKKQVFEQRAKELSKKVFVGCCRNKRFGFNLRDIEKQAREIILFLGINKGQLPIVFTPIAIYILCAKRKNLEKSDHLPIFIDQLQKELFNLLLKIYKTKGNEQSLIYFMDDLLRQLTNEPFNDIKDKEKCALLKMVYDYFSDNQTGLFVINRSPASGFSTPTPKINNYDKVKKSFDNFFNMLEFIHKIEIEDDK